MHSITENAYTGGESEWGYISRSIKLSRTVAETDITNLVHELTHALDHKNGWNYRWGIAANLKGTECLAYSAQHLLTGLTDFERFERQLKDGLYQDESSLNEAWEKAWFELRRFSRTPMAAEGEAMGNVSHKSLQELADKTGLKFSYDQLLPIYQDLVNKYMQCPIPLREPPGITGAFR